MSATLLAGMKVILDAGHVKALQDSSDDEMLIAGWATTPDLDYAGDIVEATSMSKRFDETYAKRGRVWHNHDANQVVGKVRKAHVDPLQGMFIDEAKLTPTDFVKSYLWPNIKEGALSDFSIQFFSYNPVMKDGILYHKDIEIIETSVVSVGCNPGAVITNFKSYLPSEDYVNATLEDLYKLSEQGVIRYPSQMRKQFAIDGLKDDNKPMDKPAVQMKTGFVLIPRDQKSYDPGGSLIADFKVPSQKSRHFDSAASLFLVKSNETGEHLLRVATPTKKGWNYDWSYVASAMGAMLGAKGGIAVDAELKSELAVEFAKIYKVLGKQMPEVSGDPIGDLTQEALAEIKFADVVFHEGEKRLIEESIFKNGLQSVQNILEAWKKDGGPTDEAKTALETHMKSVYGYFDASFYVNPTDPESVTFLQALISAYLAYRAARDSADGNSGYYSYAIDLEDVPGDVKKAVEQARFAEQFLKDVDPQYLQKSSDNDEEDDDDANIEEDDDDSTEDVSDGFDYADLAD